MFGWFLRLRDLEPVLFRLILSTKLFHILYLTWLHTQPCVRLTPHTLNLLTALKPLKMSNHCLFTSLSSAQTNGRTSGKVYLCEHLIR